MTGKEILDMATNIIRRQDLTTAPSDNRTLLLFFVNTMRRAIIREKTIPRLYQYNTVTPVNGVIDMEAEKIKNARKVEWQYDENGVTKRAFLAKIYTYEQAIDIYGDLATTGNPQAYLEIGTSMYILPVLTTGQINVYGEFWPADIADDATSDILAEELGEAWVYLGAAEYFDMLGETQKAQYWRGKGSAIVDKYIQQPNAQLAETTDVWRRRPFGIPGTGRRPATDHDLNQGNW